LANWDPSKEDWELYNINKDFSQANDLAKAHPKKLEELKKLFLKKLFKEVSRDNLVWPIGAGLWLRIHPEDRIKSPYTKWRFDGSTTRMPEFTALAWGGKIVTLRSSSPRRKMRRACYTRWAGFRAA